MRNLTDKRASMFRIRSDKQTLRASCQCCQDVHISSDIYLQVLDAGGRCDTKTAINL